MKWLKRKIRNWVSSNNEKEMCDQLHSSPVRKSISLDSDPLRLNIYHASGGTIVETRVYNRKTDQEVNSLHIITDADDLGETLSKIIMIEGLRR